MMTTTGGPEARDAFAPSGSGQRWHRADAEVSMIPRHVKLEGNPAQQI